VSHPRDCLIGAIFLVLYLMGSGVHMICRKELGFPFMGGSGLSVTWRMPSIDLPCEENFAKTCDC
jgi:hypothetical protein